MRADANVFIGTGHAMRCMALGQAWRSKGGRVVFVTIGSNEWLRAQLSKEGFEICTLPHLCRPAEDWQRTRALAACELDPWVLVDGYHFDVHYHHWVKEAGFRLAVIDDTAASSHYCADLLLNQNVFAEDLRYSCEPYTRRLLGARYALLRREFATFRGVKRPVREAARRVLITMGGADPTNATSVVLRAIHQLQQPDLEVRVIAGAANANIEELRAVVQCLGCWAELIVAPTAISANLAWADVAVSAAGSTALELAFMGVPALLVVIAANQERNAAKLEALGAAYRLGPLAELTYATIRQELRDLLRSQQRREAMSERCQKLVDGEGAERVTSILQAAQC
jgi:UDP-2,4-diacetamido-2,4,6-trideoxy-beta-L-altropyranose hydrolase